MLNKCHNPTEDLSKTKAQEKCLDSVTVVVLRFFSGCNATEVIGRPDTDCSGQILFRVHPPGNLAEVPNAAISWGTLGGAPLSQLQATWHHCCFSPMRNLNTTLVKAMTRLCQSFILQSLAKTSRPFLWMVALAYCCTLTAREVSALSDGQHEKEVRNK